MRPEVLALFPEGVAGADLSDLEGLPPLWPEEAAAVAAAVDRRVREFTGGRACARRALASLDGIPPTAIPRGEGGAPVWPARVVGSITHCDGYCGAVVARSTTFLGLGLDAELHGKVATELWKDLATDREMALLGSRDRDDALEWATVLFSAKEAFYKAQYPLTRAWLDFHDVEIEPLTPGQFAVVLLKTVDGLAATGRRFNGRYLVTPPHVFTAVALPAGAESAPQLTAGGRLDGS